LPVFSSGGYSLLTLPLFLAPIVPATWVPAQQQQQAAYDLLKSELKTAAVACQAAMHGK
jgi:hypothetical protein